MRSSQNMYNIYALASIDRKYVDVGLTANLDKRLDRHNKGFEKTTKPYAPFLLFYTESAKDRINARLREKYLKSRSGKRFLYKLLLEKHPNLKQYQ